MNWNRSLPGYKPLRWRWLTWLRDMFTSDANDPHDWSA